MGRALTKRHFSLIERKGVKNPLPFVYDIYKYGKARELVSFLVWELFHKLRLFPKEKYLEFNDSAPLSLEQVRSNGSDFNERIDQFFRSRGLSIINAGLNWKRMFINDNGEIFGCLYPNDTDLYKSTVNGEFISFINRFPERIKSIFISSQNTVFVCVKGTVFKSTDSGRIFKKSLDLGSSESFFRHNNAMTETPSRVLIIGEYGNVWDKNGWRKLAYLYFSSDDGETWEKSDFLIKAGTNKHIHLVKYSKLFDKILMADGDNKKKLWVSDSVNSSDLRNPNRWKPVNQFHIQMGGYTSVVEDDDKVLFGTDYQNGTNFIVETTDCVKFNSKVVPDPYRRSPIDNMVLRKSKNGKEIWAVLPYSTPGTKSLLMYTENGGKSWNKVLEYSSATHNVWLINSSNDATHELYFAIKNLRNDDRVVYKITDL
ncbi:MAG: hypothetical protein AMJ70_00275 [Dehalococcoidia bacterium SG8_51_3]|nr:MAG: hypothetical protein AMJ70_00275 [Dehalococcoidia bacterium SG8_51_3]